MRRLSVVTAVVVVVAVTCGVGPAVTVATPNAVPAKTTPPTTTVPTTSSTTIVSSMSSPSVSTSAGVDAAPPTVPPNPDNDHLFTYGDIQIPPGQPGQLSVVLGHTTDTSDVIAGTGDLMIVVRNDRDETAHGVVVNINGVDASGAQTFSKIILIETPIEPGEWAFGQADLVPRLDETSNFDVFFYDMGAAGDYADLEVSDAELRDGVISGNVINTSFFAIVNAISVHVACFHDSQITDYQRAVVETETLRLGEMTSFTTATPIDPATCTSFAIYAAGLPHVDRSDTQPEDADVVTVVPETGPRLPETVAEGTVVEVITEEVVIGTVGAADDVAGPTSPPALVDPRLEAAMLTAEDLGGDWESAGPEMLEFGPAAEPFSYCPNGAEMVPPAAGASISFTPGPTVDAALGDDEVVEAVFVFSTAQDVESWFDGLESCVGQEWEESFDPVEHVTLERIEAPDLGDESASFRTTYAHSEGPEHDNTAVLVRHGDVLVLVTYDNHGLEEPVDRSFFDGLVEAAVTKAATALA